jgi:hypothetical protein
MQTPRLLLCFVALLVGLPLQVALAADEAPITADTLLANEASWPLHVELTETWTPPGSDVLLKAPKPGVLLRVEEGGVARIDFAAGGVHDVPIAKTDIVERANAVRAGTRLKNGPVFVMTVGPRLLGGERGRLEVVDLAGTMEARGFLSVFADPFAAGFEELVAALRPFERRYGVQTVLFPLGDHMDAKVLAKLQANDWPIAFVMKGYADLYVPLLLRETDVPRVMLTTREGRVLLERGWDGKTAPAVELAIARSFGPEHVADAD